VTTSSFPQQLSTILFDVGNTLHHLDHAFIAERVAAHSHAVSVRDVMVAEHAAKRAVDAAFRQRAGGNDSGRQVRYFETILDGLAVAPALTARITDDLHAENAQRSLWRVMDPETPRALGTLRQRGFTLGVVSNADGRVAAALAASGIAEHFVTIVDSHVVGVEKPQPRIFEIALEACASVASDSLYIGDIYEVDVQGARRAGLSAALLDPLDHYVDADCPRLRSIPELLEVLPAAARRG
jgi:putative hydrolase of the HAD superfamily